jgi:hypothetical protein
MAAPKAGWWADGGSLNSVEFKPHCPKTGREGLMSRPGITRQLGFGKACSRSAHCCIASFDGGWLD